MLVVAVEALREPPRHYLQAPASAAALPAPIARPARAPTSPLRSIIGYPEAGSSQLAAFLEKHPQAVGSAPQVGARMGAGTCVSTASTTPCQPAKLLQRSLPRAAMPGPLPARRRSRRSSPCAGTARTRQARRRAGAAHRLLCSDTSRRRCSWMRWRALRWAAPPLRPAPATSVCAAASAAAAGRERGGWARLRLGARRVPADLPASVPARLLTTLVGS